MQLPNSGNYEIVGAWNMFKTPVQMAKAAARLDPVRAIAAGGGLFTRAIRNAKRYQVDKNIDNLAAESAALANEIVSQANALLQVQNPQYIAGQIATLKKAFVKVMGAMPAEARGKIMIRPAFRAARQAFSVAIGKASKHQLNSINAQKVAAAKQKAAAAEALRQQAAARAAGQAAGKAEAAAEVAAAKAAGKAEAEAARVEAKAAYDAQMSADEMERKSKTKRNLLIGGGVATAAAAAFFLV